MAFQRVPETAEVAVVYLSNLVNVQNTFYGRKVGGYSLADLELLAEGMDTWVDEIVKPIISNQINYVRVDVRGLDNENDLEATNADSAGAGGLAQNPNPNSVSFAVSRRSGFTGRSARGRIYWLPPTVNQLTSNENFILPTPAGAITDALNLVRTVMGALDFTEVIVSRYTGGEKRAEAVTFEVVEYTATDFRLDSRRDRMPSS